MARGQDEALRSRPSARVLLLDVSGRILLFKYFDPTATSGGSYWATPGGAVEEGETFELAAVRELREETGLFVTDVGPVVGQSSFLLRLTTGEQVLADERFFVVRCSPGWSLGTDWTPPEKDLTGFRWWSCNELAETSETIFPEGLLDMLERVRVCWPNS